MRYTTDMRLALDNQVSDSIVAALRNAGHTIVYHAGNEHDELWLNLALQRGAQVYVSPDYDVENFAYNRGLEFVRIKQGKNSVDTILATLSRLTCAA